MAQIRNHYDNLQVKQNASAEVIKGAYRYLSQKWHPDKNPHNKQEAERVLRIINQAYAVLSDPIERKKHDEWIARKGSEGDSTQDSSPDDQQERKSEDSMDETEIATYREPNEEVGSDFKTVISDLSFHGTIWSVVLLLLFIVFSHLKS